MEINKVKIIQVIFFVLLFQVGNVLLFTQQVKAACHDECEGGCTGFEPAGGSSGPCDNNDTCNPITVCDSGPIGAIPPDENVDSSPNFTPVPSSANSSPAAETVIKTSGEAGEKSDTLEKLYKSCASWIKDQVSSITSVFLPN
jgi:hypothetical protein